MNRYRLAIATILGLTAGGGYYPAVAGDYGRSAPFVRYQTDWSGWYFGFEGQGIWAFAGDSPVGATHVRGGGIGLYSGYNFQGGPWVWGFEGDVNMPFARGSSASGGAGNESRKGWNAGFRGRLGFAPVDRVLVFGMVGTMLADWKVGGAAAIGSPSSSSIKPGWNVGLGVEVALAENIIGRADYRFEGFYPFRESFPSTGAFSVNVTDHVLSLGAAIKY